MSSENQKANVDRLAPPNCEVSHGFHKEYVKRYTIPGAVTKMHKEPQAGTAGDAAPSSEPDGINVPLMPLSNLFDNNSNCIRGCELRGQGRTGKRKGTAHLPARAADGLQDC